MPKFVRQADNTLSGNNTFTGTNTFSGSLVASGGVTGDVTGNVTGDVVGGVTGPVPNEVVTGANVIAASESGTTFFLSGGTDYASTLPTAAAGLHFKFVVAAAPTGDVGYTITGTPAAKIQGLVAVTPEDDAGIAAADEDNVIFVNDVAAVGDWVEFVSDGTNWYVSGMVSAVEALTANT